jgi:hypothetical protein
MLQIISGRFFGDGQVEAMESDAVLYSNLLWLVPIKTAAAELRPVESPGRAVTSYVVRYVNRYEKYPDDRMVLAQADEAVDQFRLLASFWFKAFFHPDRHHVELLCRAGPRNSLDDTIPRSFVPGYLDAGDRDSFASWVGRAILDAAGRPPIQEMLAECRASFRVIDTRRLVGLSPAPRQAGEADAGPPPGEEPAALPAEPGEPRPESGGQA